MSSCLENLNFVEAGASKTIVEENTNKYISFGNWILTNLTKQDFSSIFIAIAIVILSWIIIDWFVRLIIKILWPIAFVTILVVCIIFMTISRIVFNFLHFFSVYFTMFIEGINV